MSRLSIGLAVVFAAGIVAFGLVARTTRPSAEHGRIMAEDLGVMMSRHPVADQTTANLRQAAQAMRDAGEHLAANGQAMIDYAERLRQNVGYR